ncbi:hypothetical protein [Nocardioides pinisoli]|uniref:EF-hand domain-containing protein n=1 Tax=Nocardioides pinisoli TaxID=2950279 RepID=A0ABT1KRU8_9ACTN|nr:hypothetical protein [Nocardioides pinisoli]MCP3420466.1 hypothetical protein [Nocardioides pinisoli]
MTDFDGATLTTELEPESAASEIARAVSGRHKIARKYVMRLRKRNPEASPAEIVAMLERHYVTAITVAGGVVTAGTVAANIGLALIPGVAAGKEAGKGAAKVAAKGAAKKVAAKAAAKTAAMSAAKTGAERAVHLLPAGDEQLQFEITAVFALALAEIHDMSLDQEQAHALVYGLSNGRVSQQQIAAMATDLSKDAGEPTSGLGHTIASGRDDWSHWANTLADTLPGGAAQSLVRTVQTGQLETVRSGLNGKQQSVIEYGVGALAGGATRFLFGGEVVEASRVAFAEAPEQFPSHLSDALLVKAEEEQEPNRALVAFEDAAKATGSWVSTAADRSTRVFRSVDLDGDGVPDEPQALSAVRGLGGAVGGAVSSGTRSFRRVDLDGDGVPDEPQALSAVKGAREGVASRLRRKQRAERGELEGEASEGEAAD